MSDINYGPLRFLIGTWESKGLTGQNRAPNPDRKEENTKFRQMRTFEPIGDVNNNESDKMPFFHALIITLFIVN